MTEMILPTTEQNALLDEYAEPFATFEQLLIDENQKYNLTRIINPEQIRLRHFIDSMVCLPLLDALCKSLNKSLRVLDIGSGAGFPGLVLAIVRPEWHIVSVEATDKKVRFQQKVCDKIGLSNITVLHHRAETLAHDVQFRENLDAVTARALAAMPFLAELSLGFLAGGGRALYWKGSAANDELQTARPAIEQMGATLEKNVTYTLPSSDEPVHLSMVVCKKIKKTPKQYPRVFGIIKKKPLS
jgi:16S rRNA (guanine527-N7)-methyltransferase